MCTQRAQLATHRDAPVDGNHLQTSKLGERADLLRDLAGELSGGGEHQSSRAPAVRREESVEQRQREGRGLASAGLSHAQHVAAIEPGGNGFELDRAGGLIASGADTTDERFVKPEPFETVRYIRN